VLLDKEDMGDADIPYVLCNASLAVVAPMLFLRDLMATSLSLRNAHGYQDLSSKGQVVLCYLLYLLSCMQACRFT
jgi:hypothetical protein